MKKIYQILDTPLKKGDVGIEIEVEGNNLKEMDTEVWTSLRDGSLRGENLEYVLRKPIPIGRVKDAIIDLKQELDDAGSECIFSFRTSVHVHVNVQNLNFNEYLTLIYTYLLLEEPLMTFCGKERKGNRFCLRLQDAEGILQTLTYMFRNGEGSLRNIGEEAVRYAAINLYATRKFGSLEFRGMRGNMDVDVLDIWTRALVAIREFAVFAKTPKEVYSLFSKAAPKEFLNLVLGELSDNFTYPRMVKDMQTSFSLSIDLPFSFVNQDKEQEEKPITFANNPFDMPIAAAPRRAAIREIAEHFILRDNV